MFRPPAFWSADRPYGLAKNLLWPAAQIYCGASLLRRHLTHPVQVEKPVICVGNVTLGGAGKTPVTLMLADMLEKMGQRVAILSRGYGGIEKGPIKVAPTHTARQIGDEALMMAADFPVYVGRNRIETAQLALAAGADILLMDDGLQNPTIARDCNLLIVDSTVGFGNGALFPAGPLREKIQSALQRIQAVVLINESEKTENTKQARADMCALIEACHARNIPIFTAYFVPQNIPQARLLAYCGIGRPSKFFTMLEKNGAELAAGRAFNDHYFYKEKDAHTLLQQAKKLNAQIVTTKKDMARLQRAAPNSALAELATHSQAIDIEVICEPLAELQNLLRHVCAKMNS